MDYADSGLDVMDHRGRYEKAYNTLMNWARRKMIESPPNGDARKDAGPQNMDLGGMDQGIDMGGGYGKGGYGAEYPPGLKP